VIPVEPLDVERQADALEDALALPMEQRHEWCEAIRAHVRRHDLSAWIDAQLADLDRASTIRSR
jgi:trehalose-6-phosphate synthase